MKKHLIVIGTAVLLLAVGLSGCTSTEDKLIGTWETEPMTDDVGQTATIRIIFFEDKTSTFTMTLDGKPDSMSGTWKVMDNIAYLYMNGEATPLELTLENDNTLTMSQSGRTHTFTKQ